MTVTGRYETPSALLSGNQDRVTLGPLPPFLNPETVTYRPRLFVDPTRLPLPYPSSSVLVPEVVGTESPGDENDEEDFYSTRERLC